MIACEVLIPDSSRKTIDNAVLHVLNEPLLFKNFLELSFSNKPQFANRAGRVVYYSSKSDAQIIKPYIKTIVQSINKIKIVTVKAVYYKIFSECIDFLSTEDIGITVDSAILDLQKAIQPTMVIYSCDFLLATCKQFPDLKTELIAILENQMYKEQKSIKNKVKKTIYILERLK